MLLLYTFTSFSQGPTYYNFTNCLDTLYYTDCQRFEPTKTKFLNKYLNQFYKNKKKYIDVDNTRLQTLNTKVRNSNKVHFLFEMEGDKTEIIVESKIEKRTIYDTTYLEVDEKDNWSFKNGAFDDFDKVILDKTIRFGEILTAPNSQFEFIKSIKIVNSNDTMAVPDSLISDFVFPNFINQYKGFAPIKAYYNKEQKYFALYIYSDLEKNNYPENDLLSCYHDRDTYLIKIIIDLKNNIMDRLIIDGEILTRYGACNCSDFWIF